MTEENTNLVISDKNNIASEKESTKSSSNRSSPALEPLQGFKSVAEPSDKEQPVENEVVSEEESSKSSSPLPRALKNCKVVLERTKDIEDCVQKTD
nr:unnamed protein product [Callosobruchus analis]